MDANITSEAIILAQMQYDFWQNIGLGAGLITFYYFLFKYL